MSGELYTTYDVVGIAEDVSDVISDISPTETPFLTSIGRDTCDSTLIEWQEDSLRAAAANKQVEGADATFVARTPTTLLTNRTQILADAFYVSGTNERVKKYGRDSEIAYQTAKMGKALKKDLEYTLVGAVTAASAGSETTAREMASAFSMIHSDVTLANSGTPRALTEALVVSITQTTYTYGANPSTLMIKPADALIVADFAKTATGTSLGRIRELSGTDRKIVNAVDIYVTPFGELRVVLNRHLLASSALTYDADMWKLVTLRPWARTQLAKTGDADKFQMLGEFTLKHLNQRATGRISDLS